MRPARIHHWLPVLFLGLVTVTWSAEPRYVRSELRDGDDWGALRWSAADRKQFGGEPAVKRDRSKLLLVRYSFYVSHYDTQRLNPVWVAHIDTAESAAAAAARKGEAWERKGFKFRPDANVVAFSKGAGRLWVTDDDYTNANPQALAPVTHGNRITRGHMSSNLEMKGAGDETEGRVSQEESFSFANVAPQMQGHNSPLWASLEEDCLALAAKVGRVAVLTGPVFKPGPGRPQLHTAGEGKVRVPIPTHFFKIIIAEVEGHQVALGFLVPHQPDLKADRRHDYAVPIRQIEKAAGLNFMPDWGANDAIETKLDRRLLEILQRN